MIYFNNYILLISSVFCLLEGIILYILPYSIPDTIKAIGFKRDSIINKKIAILLIVIGILFIFTYAVL